MIIKKKRKKKKKEKRKKKHLYSIYISHRFFTKFKSFEARIVDEGGMKWDACHTCDARSSSSYRNSLELSVEIPSVQIFNATYPASQTDLLFWQWYDTLCPTISRESPVCPESQGGNQAISKRARRPDRRSNPRKHRWPPASSHLALILGEQSLPDRLTAPWCAPVQTAERDAHPDGKSRPPNGAAFVVAPRHANPTRSSFPSIHHRSSSLSSSSSILR